MKKPDHERVLASLKDFQRDTVDYAFRRLWTDDDWTKRFLVADEVGLGKTMVAKGVIAKTVDYLWDKEERIDVVYICSNSQIARQNLSRLNVVGGTVMRHADRLTLLPQVIRDLRGQKINFVSFTPGTSFSVGSSGGASRERVLLHTMLAERWGRDVIHKAAWVKFFRGGVRRDRFEGQLRWFDRESLDQQLVDSFHEEIARAVGPQGGALRDELEACAAEYTHLRSRAPDELRWRRDRLVGMLRHLVAKAGVEHLEPDLVILDEFQRFKDVLDGDGYGADLAREVFDHVNARVLLLSATPFKMYTLPDEPAGDDHFADFNRTVEFLGGREAAGRVRRDLRTMRDAALAGAQPEGAAARGRVEAELRRFMARTERLASTPDRDGMLAQRDMPGLALGVQDLEAWVTFDKVARALDRHDVFEYWRSTPYPLNLMERNSYLVRQHFEAAVEREDPELARVLDGAGGLLSWQDIVHYRRVDPGNAKLRGLLADVLDRGAWQLAWLPPSLPYYNPRGAYAEPELADFTKRLIFSAWAVVPKSVAVMTSYEAERRTIEASGVEHRDYDAHRPVTPPLQYRQSGTTAALLFPQPALARLGDPLAIAREHGAMPMDRDWLIGIVRHRVDAALGRIAHLKTHGGATDSRWYWAAPALMGATEGGTGVGEFVSQVRREAESGGEDGPGWLNEHLRLFERLDGAATLDDVERIGLGAWPHDLAEVLTELALGGPGTLALRALSRVCGGGDSLDDPQVRASAFTVAQGLRSLFNKPEIVALLRTVEGEVYWREVARHCLDGCLQAVLDEYAHVLVESEGLQDVELLRRAPRIAEVMAEALSIRTAANVVEDVRVEDGRVVADAQRMSSHFAARYGRTQASDSALMREGTVRVAYNSPFRPFVLASTSVGQEGLDFHTYSHAIVHWNLPGNPVDLEQREGRVHRYKGHAVRKNVARDFTGAALKSDDPDPWAAAFAAAVAARDGADSEVVPFWVYSSEGGAKIERYVPALPLSRELQHYRRLMRTVVTYRQLLGQPRQDELIQAMGEGTEWLRIDLSPPRPA
ncbi:DEAD/DEAH box helicase [Demequina pelophila]|uniref:DEAD/DEAH box helicase n=1 Tax=Demequina pelophila TaxID=1638984 RepID=UPI0007866F08|nr:helicase-related protein [Demequina pelophila]